MAEADKKKDETTLFHYTSEEGLKKIYQSGCIKQSTDTQNDARYGKGTYLTSLAPTEPREKIARNNYAGAWKRNVEMGKLDVALMVKTPADKCPGDRDVYKHEGDIPFKDIKQIKIIGKHGEVIRQYFDI